MNGFSFVSTQPGLDEYQPGVCNIGPAEIARRRMSGHLALAVTAIGFAVLVGLGLPHWTRLLLLLPAAGAATGYIQAQLHFCAGFGSRGVFNFGALGNVRSVQDLEARRADMRRSLQIGLAALAIGLAVAMVATLLPF